MPFDWRHRKKLADIQRATSFQSGTGTLQEGGVDEEESGCELGAHPTARVDSMPQLSYDFFLITRNQNSDGGNEMGFLELQLSTPVDDRNLDVRKALARPGLNVPLFEDFCELHV